MRNQILVNKFIIAISLFLVFSLAGCSTPTHKAVDTRSTIIPKNLYAKPKNKRRKRLIPGAA